MEYQFEIPINFFLNYNNLFHRNGCNYKNVYLIMSYYIINVFR